MNPLVGFGGSIARNCGETQILSSWNCSAHWPGRVNVSVWDPIFFGNFFRLSFGNFFRVFCFGGCRRKEGRKEGRNKRRKEETKKGRKEGRKKGRKERRKEGRKKERKKRRKEKRKGGRKG